ncbi:hypothetical protein [Butyrivibrio sp. VCB2006]|uniref:hypothetical protein n=1 Tax=Butyrivibrio sp. VCB2006 TaxID=1280679 RepID=UPI000426F972|nr:hypothetical protein [Butyrivibrio sp. VCB2006]
MTRKELIKLILFLSGLALIIGRLTTILTLKEYEVGPNVNVLINKNMLCEKQDGFYSLDDNSLDVVFLGSSNIHCNINPNVIWNDYGITSYNYSCDQQELGTTFYYLKQVFETQSPKAVVIDVMSNGAGSEIGTTQAHFAFDHMKNDWYRIQAIWNRTKEARMELYFPIIAYHGRWKELTDNDYKYKKNKHNILNGSFIYMVENEMETPEIPDDIPISQLPERTIFWLDSIIKLCEENDCKCVFIKTPYTFYYEEWFSYYNAVDDYCKSKNVTFLNLNKYTEEIGLDFLCDYADWGHMNWNGQKKLSLYLGEFLVNNYDFKDKRGDVKYKQWDEDYKLMKEYVDGFWEKWE